MKKVKGISVGDKQSVAQLHTQCLKLLSQFQEKERQLSNNEYDTSESSESSSGSARKVSHAVPVDGYYGLSHPAV